MKFPGSGRKYATAPYYLSGDYSTSHIAASAPRSPGIEHYIKMEEGLSSRPGTGRDETTAQALDMTKTPLGTRAIAVRTEIDVKQDAASLKSGR